MKRFKYERELFKIMGTKDIGKLKNKIKNALKKNHVVKAAIFGSYARGEQTQKSDLDILIKFNGSLLDLVRIERELKETLGKKIDLLTYDSIHPLLKKRILEEQIRIL